MATFTDGITITGGITIIGGGPAFTDGVHIGTASNTTTGIRTVHYDTASDKLFGFSSGFSTVRLGSTTGGNEVTWDSSQSFISRSIGSYGPGYVCSDPDTSQVLVAYTTNSGNSEVAVASLSNGTVTVGTPVQLFTSNTSVVVRGMIYDTNRDEVIVMAVHDVGSSNYGGGVYGIVGSVGTRTVTFGTPINITGSSQEMFSGSYTWQWNKWEGGIEWDSNNNKFLMIYYERPTSSGSSNYRYLASGVNNGTSISIGSPNQLSYAWSANQDSYYGSNGEIKCVGSDQYVLAQLGRNSYGGDSRFINAHLVTVSGNAVSVSANVTVASAADDQFIELGYDSSSNTNIIAYSTDSDSNNAAVRVGSISNSTLSFQDAVSTSPWAAKSITYDSNNNKLAFASDNDYTGVIDISQ